MPQLIEHIDAIARKKGRDVLFLRFISKRQAKLEKFTKKPSISFDDTVDWANLTIRQKVISWLDEHNIAWTPCGDVADPSMMVSYQGQIYLDVPFDRDLASYRELAAFLEKPDGTPRFPQVQFFVVPMSVAMKNAHHDEPGFWERWAENF